VQRAPGRETDFPALALDARGTPWVAAVEWDGAEDRLVLSRAAGGALVPALGVGRPGVIHQPALAADGDGGLWLAWSQLDERGLMVLLAQRVVEGAADGPVRTLARSGAGEILPAAAGDAAGRVWVAWQSQRAGRPDVYCRCWDPQRRSWSAEVRVTDDPAGDWEPQIAFDARGDGAWIVYDSWRGGSYHLWATRVDAAGRAGEARRLTRGERFEAHASVASGGGDGAVWVAFERGRAGWGLDQRGRDPLAGLNAGKEVVLARWDPAGGAFEEAAAFVGIPGAAAREGRADRPEPAEESPAGAEREEVGDGPEVRGRKAPRTLNLPRVVLDAGGRPWVAVRFFQRNGWRVALAGYDRAARQWSRPAVLAESVYGQDRLVRGAAGPDGSLWLAWPADGRTSSAHGQAAVHLARVDPAAWAGVAPGEAPAGPDWPAPRPYLHAPAPAAAGAGRRRWTVGGATYELLWGDLHRHSDASPCFPESDGSAEEQYRYAIDVAGLDFLATTDHTDTRRPYHPYDWWLAQKAADLFQAPGEFVTFYAYEREQYWPRGHRNVVFADRGGPVVYRRRSTYLASPWQARYPVDPQGPAEILPAELWRILRAWGRPVTAIAHTTGSGSGVDWEHEPRADPAVESVVEVYQGARISYEGVRTPQPEAGLRAGDTAGAGGPAGPAAGDPLHNFVHAGVYQRGLRAGHRLGVVASSDHLSEHVSYAGVYVRERTRAGILEAIAARRTFGATDRIAVELSAGGRPMGAAGPADGVRALEIAVEGTGPLARVTLLRNEEDYRSWEPGAASFRILFTDPAPAAGENRYYLRVEQADGNMAWSSPLWLAP